jgi:hypothetical protein
MPVKKRLEINRAVVEGESNEPKLPDGAKHPT